MKINLGQHGEVPQTVIRYPWLFSAIVACILAIALAIIGVGKLWSGELNNIRTGVIGQWSVWVLIAAGPLILLVLGVTSSRRKLVITPHEVIYWPPIGRPRETGFAEVRTIEKGNIFYFGIVGSAANLMLKDGEVTQIPLDLPKPDEVFNQLKQYVETHKRQTDAQ